jgi:hypothetical protein
MSEQGTLLYGDEASRFIESIDDPITRNLVTMAFVRLVQQVFMLKGERPRTDLDALFLVKTLRDFFSEHDVLARTLDGEKVGAWFDDET